MTGDQQHDAQLIGQFGVGFYSAFIVADKVTVDTRRAGQRPGRALGVQTARASLRSRTSSEKNAARCVTLHLKDDETEFAEPVRIETLIRKYSDHIGFPVIPARRQAKTKAKVVNSATALWTRSRTDIEDDEYKEFYKYLSHDFADPLTWSHNRVEGKREYTSLLYIPAAAPFDLWNREAPRGLKLYVQRVFIMDDAEQFLPLYLRFVKGVVDSADLPLNVSRELLQQNPDLAAMRGALTKRVLDMLSKLAGGDDYATFWARVRPGSQGRRGRGFRQQGQAGEAAAFRIDPFRARCAGPVARRLHRPRAGGAGQDLLHPRRQLCDGSCEPASRAACEARASKSCC